MIGAARWLVLLGLLVPLAGFAGFVAAALAVSPAPAGATDGIAVLTGGAERLETGMRLLREGRAACLLISGAHPDVRLADLARIVGEPETSLATRVAIGHGATSTRGNAAEIAAWSRAKGFASVRVVTASYHMPRALLELRRALPAVALVPHKVLPSQLRGWEALGHGRVWRLLAAEYLKLIGATLGLGAPPAAPAIGAERIFGHATAAAA